VNNSTGIIISNLGTPKSTQAQDVGKYLKEFLNDPFVISMPQPFRSLFVNLLIVPRRSHKSAAAYKKIWTQEGSPLLVNSQKLIHKLKKLIPNNPIELAMRYGSPNLEQAFEKMQKKGMKSLLIFPQYPQYAEASTETTKVHCKKINQKYGFKLKFIDYFYNEDFFLNSYAELFNSYIKNKKLDLRDTYVLFSYHGLPIRQLKSKHPSHCYVSKGCCDRINDSNQLCYKAQSLHTTKKLAELFSLKNHQFSSSFQSRLGPVKWIEPYTDKVLEKIALSPNFSFKNILVITPAFTADNLETLEEIAIEGKNSFDETKTNKTNFYTLPCLNDFSPWAEAQSKFIKNNLSF